MFGVVDATLGAAASIGSALAKGSGQSGKGSGQSGKG